MSLVTYPGQEVVYNLDKACDPAKITLTFCQPPTPSTSVEQPADPQLPSIKQNFAQNFVAKSIKKEEEEPILMETQNMRIQRKKKNIKKRREEFLERSVMTALYGAVEQKVQCACMSTDHLLVQKRTRLRELLLAEEVAYTAEYIAMCQQAKTNKDEEVRRRAFELKARTERERKRLAEQKILERKIQSCEETRPVITQKTLMEVKKDQLWQIKEKYAKEESRREEERMYHDLMVKNMLAVKENEEENAKLAWIKQKNAQEAFMELMKTKKEKEEEEKRLKEFEKLQLEEEIRLIKEEKEKEMEEKRRKKAEMKAEIQDLLEREKEIKERRKREEDEIDPTLAELLKIEEEKEKRKEVSNKERLKREMDIFLESSRELKRQKEEEDKKIDQILEDLNEKKRIQKDAERKRLKAAREELFSEVLRERDLQIKQKQIRQKLEEEQNNKEIELLTLQMNQQEKIRQEYERRCAEQREDYRRQLMQQMREVEELKKRQKEKEEDYIKRKRAAQEKEIEEVKALLKDIPLGGKDHPMKAIMKQIPPKYACPFPCPR